MVMEIGVVTDWSIIIRFYYNSTMRKQVQPDVFLSSFFTPAFPVPAIALPLNQESYLHAFNQYCRDLLELSNFLNVELLKNGDLIALSLALTPPTPPQSDGSVKGSDSTTSRKYAS
jgi:hypothetical protein